MYVCQKIGISLFSGNVFTGIEAVVKAKRSQCRVPDTGPSNSFAEKIAVAIGSFAWDLLSCYLLSNEKCVSSTPKSMEQVNVRALDLAK
jgi:hypothetical protein